MVAIFLSDPSEPSGSVRGRELIGECLCRCALSRISLGCELALVPVGIGEWHCADVIEPLLLVPGEGPLCGGEVVAELLVRARAEDDRRDQVAGAQPIERHLRARDPGP